MTRVGRPSDGDPVDMLIVTDDPTVDRRLFRLGSQRVQVITSGGLAAPDRPVDLVVVDHRILDLERLDAIVGAVRPHVRPDGRLAVLIHPSTGADPADDRGRTPELDRLDWRGLSTLAGHVCAYLGFTGPGGDRPDAADHLIMARSTPRPPPTNGGDTATMPATATPERRDNRRADLALLNHLDQCVEWTEPRRPVRSALRRARSVARRVRAARRLRTHHGPSPAR